MYHTTNIILAHHKHKELISYCNKMCLDAKLFKNSVIFRCRQLLSAHHKNFMNLSQLELDVLNEFKLTTSKYKEISDTYYLPNYYHFDHLFKITNNIDYYNALPMQSTQHLIKEVLESFKGFFNAIKSYSKNNNNFTGKPKLPNYIKTDKISFSITNQDAVIKIDKDGKQYLKLPKTKVKLFLGKLNLSHLKEVVIKPYYNTYKICIITEIEKSNNMNLNKNNILGIDFGIQNIVTTSNNCGLQPLVIKGNTLKSFNQWYNKTLSNYKSKLSKNQYTSKRIQLLNKYRANRMKDTYCKITHYIMNYCIQNNIGTIIIGHNTNWKQNANIGNKNNQIFCQLSHSYLELKLKEMGILLNIDVTLQEESYTSKASFLDNDNLPIYDAKNANTYQFSGKRITRGLYKSKEGILLNADVNGASNIIRKQVKTAFQNILDNSYLYKKVEAIYI